MLICSQPEMQELGLKSLIASCACRSPQGIAARQAMHFWHAEEKAELEEEFRIIGALRDYIPAHEAELAEAEAILGRFRTLSGSLRRLKEGQSLDETEFFELKRALQFIRQLSQMKELQKTASVRLWPLPQAEALLNPDGMNPLGFYVYSQYSEKLAEIRQEKKNLERKIAQSQGEERAELLKERSLIVIEERAETGEQLLYLSREMAKFAPDIECQLAGVSLLDFRLAKARLAERWQAAQPLILAPKKGSQIKGAFHPLRRQEVEDLGQRFTPQSIELEDGSTIISGANMGGKSIALQSFLLALVLTQMGYCPPCEALSTELYDFFAYTADLPGKASEGLSSFGMEASEIREQLRLAKEKRGLVVMDEPCRGTNPKEATAITRALCQIYAENRSSLLIASHYHIPARAGQYYYQIAGLRENALDKAPPASKAAEHKNTDDKQTKDRQAVRYIHQQMDYRLIKIDGSQPIPAAAIKIAEWMGIDHDAISCMRDHYEEINL